MKRLLFGSLIFMVCLLVCGCGGGGGGSQPAQSSSDNPITQTITGTAAAPSGSALAREAGRAAAATTGLVPIKTGTPVNIYALDASGNTTGAPLASGTISNGAFSLTLNTTLTSSMAVLIGSGNNRLRAFLTSTSNLAVNPVSEYVVTRVCTYGAPLKNYTLQELSGVVSDVNSAVQTNGFDYSVHATVASSVQALDAVASISGAMNQALATAYGSDNQAALCSSAALIKLDDAKKYIFKTTVTRNDYIAAQGFADQALADSANCPDANFLSAILDMLGEMDRIGTNVLTDPQPVFPFNLTYNFTDGTLNRALGAASNPVFGGLPRTAASLDSTSPISAIQAEIENTTLGVLTGALQKLETARTGIGSDADWAFTYPMDPANPDLGNEYLNKNDVALLDGALALSLGFIEYLLAYHLDAPSNYLQSDPCLPALCYKSGGTVVCSKTPDYLTVVAPNRCAAADTNSDGILTPNEYLVPAPFGTLKSNGAARVASARTHINNGLALLESTVDAILAQSSKSLAGLSLSSAYVNEAQYYKHYLSELRASFAGTTTNITIPGSADCWRSYRNSNSSVTYYYPRNVPDPAYNTDQLQNCLLQVTTREDATVPVNMAALFDITDFRNTLPAQLTIVGDKAVIPQNYAGNTAGGLFPQGIQESWFDVKSYDFRFGFNLTDVSGNPLAPAGGSVSMTIGANAFTASTTTSSVEFSRGAYMITPLPQASDYVSINEVFGMPVFLSTGTSNALTATTRVYNNGTYSAVLSAASN